MVNRFLTSFNKEAVLCFYSLALGLLGGLGLFLYGMKQMSAGMQKAAGEKLHRILEILTANPYMAT